MSRAGRAPAETEETGVVRSREASRVGFAWLSAVVFLGLTAALTAAAVRSGPTLWALGIALPAALGMHLLGHAIARTARWKRFGSAVLRLDPVPGTVGGHAGGTVTIPLRPGEAGRAVAAGSFRVTLTCIRTRITRSTSRRRGSRWDGVVWREEVVPAVSSDGRGLEVRFAVSVPADAPPGEPPSDDYHHWAFRVVGRLPGADFDQTFEVPVRRMAEPRFARGVEPSPVASTQIARESGAGVEFSPSAQGLRAHFPAGREWRSGLALGTFGCVFLAASLFLRSRDGKNGPGGFVTDLLFGGFALVGGLMILLGLYAVANGLDVEITRDRIVSRRSLFGLPVRRRTARVGDLQAVRMEVANQSGQGAEAVVSYRITGLLRGGDRIALGDGLRGGVVAGDVARLVEQATGLVVENAPGS